MRSHLKKCINNQQCFHNYSIVKILNTNKNYIEILVNDSKGNEKIKDQVFNTWLWYNNYYKTYFRILR